MDGLGPQYRALWPCHGGMMQSIWGKKSKVFGHEVCLVESGLVLLVLALRIDNFALPPVVLHKIPVRSIIN